MTAEQQLILKRRANLAWGDLMAVPEDVGLDAVGAAILGLGHQLGPHLRARVPQS